MERSLMLSGGGGGGSSVLTSMRFAVHPIAKVFTMCFLGFLMATKYVGILNADGRKLLNGALAIVIGAVPSLKHFVLTNDAPLFFFTDACIILGEAMIPCTLLALGGNLVDGPGAGSKKLGLRTTAAIIFGRLVLVPPAGLGVVTLVDRLGFIPRGDAMFKFVLLLQHSMPTSVLSGAVASLRGCGEESAAVLFWMYVCAVFSVAGWMALYIKMLF